jgi:hypothetical protein
MGGTLPPAWGQAAGGFKRCDRGEKRAMSAMVDEFDETVAGSNLLWTRCC